MVKALALSTFPQPGRRADLSGLFFICDGSCAVIAANASWSVEDAVGAIGVVADPDIGLDEMRPERTFRDLQLEAVERHAIVVADLAVFLDTEDLVEIYAGDGHEG